MLHQPITAGDHRQQLAPFLNARFNLQRTPDGYVVPRSEFVDILTKGVEFFDADVREIDDNGVTVCQLGGFGCFIPWDEVQSVRVRMDYARPLPTASGSTVPMVSL